MMVGVTSSDFPATYSPVWGREQHWSSHSLLKLLSIIMFALTKKKKLEQQEIDPIVSPKSSSS